MKSEGISEKPIVWGAPIFWGANTRRGCLGNGIFRTSSSFKSTNVPEE